MSCQFTESVRQVLQLARVAARRYGAPRIEPKHLLLALLTSTGGERLASVLQRRGNVAVLRESLAGDAEPLPDSVEGLVPDLPYSAAAKRMLEGAMVEARRIEGRNSKVWVTPLHVLAGAHYVPPWRRVLLQAGETEMGALLRSVGLDLAVLRAELENSKAGAVDNSAA